MQRRQRFGLLMSLAGSTPIFGLDPVNDPARSQASAAAEAPVRPAAGKTPPIPEAGPLAPPKPLDQLGKSAREAIDEAQRFGDADTADVSTEIGRETDKQLWLVEAHPMPSSA